MRKYKIKINGWWENNCCTISMMLILVDIIIQIKKFNLINKEQIHYAMRSYGSDLWAPCIKHSNPLKAQQIGMFNYANICDTNNASTTRGDVLFVLLNANSRGIISLRLKYARRRTNADLSKRKEQYIRIYCVCWQRANVPLERNSHHSIFRREEFSQSGSRHAHTPLWINEPSRSRAPVFLSLAVSGANCLRRRRRAHEMFARVTGVREKRVIWSSINYMIFASHSRSIVSSRADEFVEIEPRSDVSARETGESITLTAFVCSRVCVCLHQSQAIIASARAHVSSALAKWLRLRLLYCAQGQKDSILFIFSIDIAHRCSGWSSCNDMKCDCNIFNDIPIAKFITKSINF